MLALARRFAGATAAFLLLAGLAWHWTGVFRDRAVAARKGVTLVVFGPSGWDTLVPGASPDEVARIVAPLDAAFRRLHPEVGTIEHDSRGPVSEGVARLRNAYVAGDPVDVVLCAANPVNTSYARLGLIRPLDDFVRRIGGRFRPEAIENFRVGGRVWAVPVSAVNISTLFYNRDMLARAGVAPPRSYADFVAAAPKLRAIGAAPIIHQGKNAWMWTPWYFSALVQVIPASYRDYLDAIMAGRARFTDAPSRQALALTRRWRDSGVLDAGSSELDEEGMKAAFLRGRAATFFGGTWDLGGIRANAPFELGMTSFPRIDGAPGRPRAFGGAEAGLCLGAGSRRPDLALAYIEFLTRDENARALLDPQRPFATSHVDIDGMPGATNDQLRAQLPADKPLEWGFPPEVNEIIQRELQAMMTGAQSPAQTAEAMQRRFDALVAEGSITLRRPAASAAASGTGA